MPSSLSRLQRRIWVCLAGMEPPWTLSGGGALAGVHMGHRTTRDLDLFWHSLHQLPNPRLVIDRLLMAGLTVDSLQTSPGLVQLRVAGDDDVTIVDLVADPVPVVEAPEAVALDGAVILVDTPYEILINTLCALLSRAEFRDLVDLDALLHRDLDWRRALIAAETKDGGFSAATLAWVLKDMPVRAVGAASGAPPAQIEAMCRFRDQLTKDLVALSRPQQEPR